MLLELPINSIHIKCTCLQNVYCCLEREDLVFKDDVTRVKKMKMVTQVSQDVYAQHAIYLNDA